MKPVIKPNLSRHLRFLWPHDTTMTGTTVAETQRRGVELCVSLEKPVMNRFLTGEKVQNSRNINNSLFHTTRFL